MLVPWGVEGVFHRGADLDYALHAWVRRVGGGGGVADEGVAFALLKLSSAKEGRVRLLVYLDAQLHLSLV